MRDFFMENIEAFVKKNKEAIETIFSAYGCRENWLQAEIFRWFRKKGFKEFFVNDTSVLSGKSIDCYMKTPQHKIACEIKLLGNNGYQTKSITGGRIKELINSH